MEAGEGAAPSAWLTLGSSATPVKEGFLARWNTYGVQGIWTLRLTVSDAVGNKVVTSVVVTVPTLPQNGVLPLIKALTALPNVFSPNGDAKLKTTQVSHELSGRCQDHIEVLDAAGTVVRESPTLDKAPPQTVITALASLTADAVNTISPQTIFTLTATDSMAGVKGIWYRIDGGQWLLFADGFTQAGLKAGSHTISCSACDNVGNNEAERTISVRLVLTEVKKEISSEPVVLVGAWQDGANKVNNRSVIDTLSQILSSLGNSYHVAENGDDFKQSFRSGRFTTYILVDYKDEKVGAELREAVNHGDSLIFIKTQPAFDAILNETFGVKFTGKTTSDNLLIHLLESPLGSEGTLQSSGKPVVIGEIQANTNTVMVFGQVDAKHNLYPAITLNEYGRARLFFTPSTCWAVPTWKRLPRSSAIPFHC